MIRPSACALLAGLMLLPGAAMASIAGLWAECDTVCEPGNMHCLSAEATFEAHTLTGLSIFVDVEQAEGVGRPSLLVDVVRHRIIERAGQIVVEWRAGPDVTESLIVRRSADRIDWRELDCTEDCDIAMCRLDAANQPMVGILRYLAHLHTVAPRSLPDRVAADEDTQALFPHARFALVFPRVGAPADFALVGGVPVSRAGQAVYPLRPGVSLVLLEGAYVRHAALRAFFGVD